jgi:hypothetical protein
MIKVKSIKQISISSPQFAGFFLVVQIVFENHEQVFAMFHSIVDAINTQKNILNQQNLIQY